MPTLALAPLPVYASDCFQDPIITHDWSGTVTTGARVRDVACMEGSVVMTTLNVGTIIDIVGETDGWWKVKLTDGREGWVGTWLITTNSSDPTDDSTDAEEGIDDTAEDATDDSVTGIDDSGTDVDVETELEHLSSTHSEEVQDSIRERVRGHILLQVERHGEAWYVDPETGLRSYMKDGPTAYELMRKHGLGISEDDFEDLGRGNSGLTKRLVGQILLRVHQHGEAYYVSPIDGSIVYLKDGPAAYELMRQHGLGVTDNDLGSIEVEVD